MLPRGEGVVAKVNKTQKSNNGIADRGPNPSNTKKLAGVRGYPYGIFCPCPRWLGGWGWLGLFRRRRRRRRRRRGSKIDKKHVFFRNGFSWSGKCS